MIGDDVTSFAGREDLWAALCAMDTLEHQTVITPRDAASALDSVWDFVEENCREYSERIPAKAAALLELQILIAMHQKS